MMCVVGWCEWFFCVFVCVFGCVEYFDDDYCVGVVGCVWWCVDFVVVLVDCY